MLCLPVDMFIYRLTESGPLITRFKWNICHQWLSSITTGCDLSYIFTYSYMKNNDYVFMLIMFDGLL